MADLYDSLTPDKQAAFRAALFAKISPAACPTVDVGGIDSPDALIDGSKRWAATDCYQSAHGIGAAGAGVLDEVTYQAIMAAMPMWEKALLLGGGLFVAWRLLRKKRAR